MIIVMQPHAGEEDVHFAIGVAPDFFGGGLAVDFGVGGVVKLAGHKVGVGVVFH